jgi:hypothetical protein
VTSPFAATKAIPLNVELITREETLVQGNWGLVAIYAIVTLGLNAWLLALMIYLFNVRWRVAG